MRKVIVSENLRIDGKWQMVDKGEAVFHSFGLDYDEFSEGACGYSTAIVEWPDGKVDMVRADRVRFVMPTASI